MTFGAVLALVSACGFTHCSHGLVSAVFVIRLRLRVMWVLTCYRCGYHAIRPANQRPYRAIYAAPVDR